MGAASTGTPRALAVTIAGHKGDGFERSLERRDGKCIDICCRSNESGDPSLLLTTPALMGNGFQRSLE